MWPVSGRFLDALTGSHELVTRVRAFATGPFAAADPTTDPDPRFGVDPFDGDNPPRLDVIDGDVKLTRTGEVRGTASLRTSGDRWDLLQPWGVTLFAERGIDFGDGTQEYVPLGYFRINDLDQESAPLGPIDVQCEDRSAQVIQNKVLHPSQVPEGMTHRQLFDWLVNGVELAGQPAYRLASYIYRSIPITWDADTYNPDTTIVSGEMLVEDGDGWGFLREAARQQGCAVRFDEAGEVRVEREVPTDLTPVWDVRPGSGGGLIRATRAVSRDGIYNVAVGYGTDPAVATGRRVGQHEGTDSPFHWSASHFGPAVRFFGSPLLRTTAQTDAAVDTLADRSARSTLGLRLEIVPNPALRPNDVLSVDLGDGNPPELRIIDDVTIPLAGEAAMTVTTLPMDAA